MEELGFVIKAGTATACRTGSERARQWVASLCLSVVLVSCAPAAPTYDIVIEDGRVIDPESGLDGIRNVGIVGDSIAAVTSSVLTGVTTIDAPGLVVAPGFIDLHRHLQSPEGYRLAALDGVTMALELEAGVPDIGRFLAARQGRSPVHFGASASHWAAREVALGGGLQTSMFGDAAASPPPSAGPGTNDPASADELRAILARLEAEVSAGALGIGMGLEYHAYIISAEREEARDDYGFTR